MATNGVTFKLGNPDEKKHVVKYTGDGPVSSIYLDKDAAKQMGNPDEITVTIKPS